MAEKTQDTAVKTKEKKQSFWQGVKQEWQKIIWSTKDELIKQTILVLIISIVMGVIITVIDSAALQLVNWLMAI